MKRSTCGQLATSPVATTTGGRSLGRSCDASPPITLSPRRSSGGGGDPRRRGPAPLALVSNSRFDGFPVSGMDGFVSSSIKPQNLPSFRLGWRACSLVFQKFRGFN
ncbi:hypothetical protein PVAP13_5KG079887 [Panicum virgatum]|uniref:Uncharacterized protein n=1 Tax=Panicum virgatum TaxID=38727 RepID=A0A8T0S8N4_PANVG|nr:hypothetical protein PVAP13_5KG079887 [Panicum virgatum]